MNDWRRLNAYPRYSAGTHGGRRKYAARQALMMRLRNQMEGYFSRVKTSLKLAGKDASRVRFQSIEVYETLLHLGELRFNALSLAQERLNINGTAPQLPDGTVGPLPSQGEGGYRAAAGYTRHSAAGWSTGTTPLRLRAGQQAPAPTGGVPSAMSAAARAARNPQPTPPPGPPPAQVVHTVEPGPISVTADGAAPPAPASDVLSGKVVNARPLPDNVVRVDFAARKVSR